MKALYLLDHAGSVRSGRATFEQIEDVLEGRDSDRLATIAIDDGELVATPLGDGDLAELRVDLVARRAEVLRDALDAHLACLRGVDGLRGVSTWGAALSIDLNEAPWAETVMLAWAEERRLHLETARPPSKPGKWERRVEIKLTEKSWSATVAHMRWPAIHWTPDEMVAHDAAEEGRADMAVAIRSAAATEALEEAF